MENKLREYRVASGRTIMGLSRVSGVSRQTITDLEKGQREGSLETWLKLSNTLGIPVEKLTEKSYGESLGRYTGKVLAPTPLLLG